VLSTGPCSAVAHSPYAVAHGPHKGHGETARAFSARACGAAPCSTTQRAGGASHARGAPRACPAPRRCGGIQEYPGKLPRASPRPHPRSRVAAPPCPADPHLDRSLKERLVCLPGSLLRGWSPVEPFCCWLSVLPIRGRPPCDATLSTEDCRPSATPAGLLSGALASIAPLCSHHLQPRRRGGDCLARTAAHTRAQAPRSRCTCLHLLVRGCASDRPSGRADRRRDPPLELLVHATFLTPSTVTTLMLQGPVQPP